jgi:hypothetical protein
MLKRIFGPKMDENGVWKSFHSFYYSLNVVRVIKSKILSWEENVA